MSSRELLLLWVTDMKATFDIFPTRDEKSEPGASNICIPFILKKENGRFEHTGVFCGVLTQNVGYYCAIWMHFWCDGRAVTILPWSLETAVLYSQYENAPFEDTFNPRLTKFLQTFRDVSEPWQCVVCGQHQEKDNCIVGGHYSLNTYMGKVWFKRDFTCASCVLTARADHFSYPVLAKARTENDPPLEPV